MADSYYDMQLLTMIQYFSQILFTNNIKLFYDNST